MGSHRGDAGKHGAEDAGRFVEKIMKNFENVLKCEFISSRDRAP